MYARDSRANGKLGAVGFCWGGGTVNALAVADERSRRGRLLRSAAAGRQVPRIRAALLLHYAGSTSPSMPASRLRGGAARGRQALRDPGLPRRQSRLQQRHQRGALHRAAADLAWTRTLAFFRSNLAATG
jgi:carboxymethylenebutenolidase